MYQPKLLISSLEYYGINFLAGQKTSGLTDYLPPKEMMAGLAAHSDARLRLALIAALLQRPEFSINAASVLNLLTEENHTTFKLLYTAACFLQLKYFDQLQELLGPIEKIPDLFSRDLGLHLSDLKDTNLQILAARHTELSGLDINWFGTYDHAAKRVIARLKRELEWSMS